MRLIIALSVLLNCLPFSIGQRNSQEESICAPFLTSKSTSPLISNLKRNLTIDEDGEFSCELVLQDRFLPAQIRLTIHEGLYYLALRHLEMNVPRELEALRHAKILAEMVPSNYLFQYYAGSWSLNPNIFNIGEAEQYLYEALYGKGTKTHSSKSTPLSAPLKYLIHHSYIKSLSYQYKYDHAYQELSKFLEEFPFDLEMQFYLNELKAKYPQFPDPPSSTLGKELMNVLNELQYYSMEYSGFIPKESIETAWQIDRLTVLPSAEEFNTFLTQRKPFVISLGNVKSLDSALQWKVSQWFQNMTTLTDSQYSASFLQRVASEKVLVEKALKTLPLFLEDDNAPKASTRLAGEEIEGEERVQEFGLGASVNRQVQVLRDLVTNHFQDHDHYYYVNIQLPNQTNPYPYYNSPLHHVQEDIPILVHDEDADKEAATGATSAEQFFSCFASNLTSVTLWMGDTTVYPNPTESEANYDDREVASTVTRSRLHRDALDNLYIVLHGKKQFRLFNPTFAKAMHTLSPTYAVNPDGLGYQFNINAFLQFLQAKKGLSYTDLLTMETPHSELLLKLFSQQNITYDIEDIHFSTLSKELFPTSDAVVELNPGDILYLPTGWFHEVSSFAGAHTAINLWWKPLHWPEAKMQEERVQNRLHELLLEKLLPNFKADHDVVETTQEEL